MARRPSSAFGRSLSSFARSRSQGVVQNRPQYQSSWLDAIPTIYAGEEALHLELIMCSPLTSDQRFRNFAHVGEHSVPYTAIITKVALMQDR